MTHSDNGFFDNFGGKYVAEVLRRPLDELELAFNEAIKDPLFIKELETIQRDYIGRETPLLFAVGFSYAVSSSRCVFYRGFFIKSCAKQVLFLA